MPISVRPMTPADLEIAGIIAMAAYNRPASYESILRRYLTLQPDARLRVAHSVCENINSMGMYTERRAMWRCSALLFVVVERLRKISQNAVAAYCCRRISGKGE